MSAEMLSGMASAVGSVSKGVEAASGVTSGVVTVAEKAASPVQTIGSLQNDMFIPSLNKDIFSNTRPAATFVDFQDRAVLSKSFLRDTIPIASAKVSEAEVLDLVQDEITPGITSLVEIKPTQGIKQPESDFGLYLGKIEEPEIRTKVLGEMKIASNIKTLLEEAGVGEKEAVRVSTEALNKSLAKKDLPGVKTMLKEATEEDEEDKEKQDKVDRGVKTPEFVRDEFADEARRKDGESAIEMVFGNTSEAEKEIKGSDVAGNMHTTPAEAEISELALRHGQKHDGSYAEILDEIKKSSFRSKEEAKKKLEKLIYEKPAVTTGAGKVVRDEDIRRVLTFKGFSNPFLDFITRFVRDSR